MLKTSFLVLACLASSILNANCTKTRAGIRRIYVIESSEVTAFTSNVAEEVATITATSSFFTIEFPKNTAFFNQEMTVAGSESFLQTISFNEPGYASALVKQLNDLNGCCSMVVIVETNAGQRVLAGVSFDRAADDFIIEDMRVGSMTHNTGADAAADQNQFTVVLNANVFSLAPNLAATATIP